MLLQNSKGVLPLDLSSYKSVAIIGPCADDPVCARLTKKHLLFSNCVHATDNQGSWVALYGGQSFLNCKLYNSLLTREVIPRTTVSTGGI